jgi:hypothetical protein
MNDQTILTLTGWDLILIAIGWAVGSFIWGFGRAAYSSLKKADATFDNVVNTAIEYFPDSYIWVRRGRAFFIDDIAVTIITEKK